MKRGTLYTVLYLGGMGFWWLVLRFLVAPRIAVERRTLWEFYLIAGVILGVAQYVMYLSERIDNYEAKIRIRVWVVGLGAGILLALILGWAIRTGVEDPGDLILALAVAEGMMLIGCWVAYKTAVHLGIGRPSKEGRPGDEG